jgi:hypothetical protein
MRRACIALVLFAVSACATTQPAPPAPGQLSGTWDVSLQYSATEPQSSTVMVLNVSAAGTLTGTFYDSPFEDAEFSLRGKTLAFGAVTSDGKAAYNHSGRLVGDRIEGQTHSLGRDFLMIWTATRQAAPDATP